MNPTPIIDAAAEALRMAMRQTCIGPLWLGMHMAAKDFREETIAILRKGCPLNPSPEAVQAMAEASNPEGWTWHKLAVERGHPARRYFHEDEIRRVVQAYRGNPLWRELWVGYPGVIIPEDATEIIRLATDEGHPSNTWRPMYPGPTDKGHEAYVFFQSKYEEGDFITPDRTKVHVWAQKAREHPTNEVIATHWWDGDKRPPAQPDLDNPRPKTVPAEAVKQMLRERAQANGQARAEL